MNLDDLPGGHGILPTILIPADSRMVGKTPGSVVPNLNTEAAFFPSYRA
jgi:hypothetical protein